MNVYIVEKGLYETEIESVHSSLEAAIGFYPDESWEFYEDGPSEARENVGGGQWFNGKDGQNWMRITAFELDP